MRALLWGLAAVVLFLLVATGFAVLEPRAQAFLSRFELRQRQQEQQGRILAAYRSTVALGKIGSAILGDVPSATRLRIAVIHRAEPGVPLRFDVTLVLGTGFNAAFSDVPLSQWQSYLDDFLVHRCASASLRDAQLSPEDRVHLLGMKVSAEAACALTDAKGDLLGAVVITWEDGSKLPDDLDGTLAMLRRAATEISSLVPEL